MRLQVVVLLARLVIAPFVSPNNRWMLGAVRSIFERLGDPLTSCFVDGDELVFAAVVIGHRLRCHVVTSDRSGRRIGRVLSGTSDRCKVSFWTSFIRFAQRSPIGPIEV